MKQYKHFISLTSFKERVKFDKPIIQKNSNDFDDSDIDPESSFEDSNNSDPEIEIENKQTKDKSSSSKCYNKVLIHKSSFAIKEKEDNNCHISKNLFKDNNIYSDKEQSDKENNNIKVYREKQLYREKEKECNDKIEKELIISTNKKEMITKERIQLAEKINYKDEPDKIINTDQFGFIKNDDIKTTKNKKNRKKSFKKIRASKSCKELLQINARIEKWEYMMQHYNEFITKKKELLKSRTRKGIPDSLRGYVWQIFAEKDKYYIPNLYKELQNQPSKEELERTILKDLDRTFPLCQFFREKYGNGQRKLYKVLSAYSIYNTEVGYVQGMAFMTAIFLIYMDEESSFFMTHSLMKKYQIEDIFLSNFPGLRKKFFIFLNLQKKLLPKIYNIFQRDGVLPTMYVSTWFISLFSRSLEFSIAIRIFDCFFLEGFKVIYRIALALLKLKEDEFCKGAKGCSLHLLQKICDNVDEEELFKVAFAFSISRSQIEKYEKDYEMVINDSKNEFIAQLFF